MTCEIEAHAIADHVRRTGANTVQVVNHIDARESERLAVLLPTIRRVQVLHVEDHTVLDLADAYSPFVHALLLDSGRPSAAVPELGGTGRVHDWAISADLVRRSPRPVFLAGGLTPTTSALPSGRCNHSDSIFVRQSELAGTWTPASWPHSWRPCAARTCRCDSSSSARFKSTTDIAADSASSKSTLPAGCLPTRSH